jgi:hypothetical protein
MNAEETHKLAREIADYAVIPVRALDMQEAFKKRGYRREDLALATCIGYNYGYFDLDSEWRIIVP